MSDDVKLPSGRTFYANNGIVGIDDQGEVHEGYDGVVAIGGFTPQDRSDLADMMIARWTKFKEAGQRANVAV